MKSPNPVFSHVDVPLASTFILSSKPGKEAYVVPVVENDGYRFTVKVGTPSDCSKNGTKVPGKGAGFICLLSGSPMSGTHIKQEAKLRGLGNKLMAIVAQGQGKRIYLSPITDHESIVQTVFPEWKPSQDLVGKARDQMPLYGMNTYGDLFTPRQLVALTTFSDLVGEARERILQDAVAAGLKDDNIQLDNGGSGTRAYAEAVSVYLACGISRSADFWSNLCIWANQPKNEIVTHLFGRQAIPMAWDYAEANPFSTSGGNFEGNLSYVAKGVDNLNSYIHGYAKQIDAVKNSLSEKKVVSTDPPYYDNISYADLSDYFYIWLRYSLRNIFSEIFSTVAVPKEDELIASTYRHGNKITAENFFLKGMTQAIRILASQVHPASPITIYYAFKQSETKERGTNSTGWETFLEAIIQSDLTLSGTWPMRTEREGRMIGNDANALASSIVLVCRPRAKDAGTISRRQFVRMLNENLPTALDAMTRIDESDHSPVAPVDLSQAIIGPGMAIFSRYEAVLEADGTPMTVRTALQLINRFLAEDDFDADTQFCLHWFEQHGWEIGKFGEADTLARAKGTSVDGVKLSGVIESGGGNVRLLKWKEYPTDWDPANDKRLPVWEALHQLIRVYSSQGDSGAAGVFTATASKAEAMRQLAYRLYTLCERKGRAEDARPYNEIVTGWSNIESVAAQIPGREQQVLPGM